MVICVDCKQDWATVKCHVCGADICDITKCVVCAKPVCNGHSFGCRECELRTCDECSTAATVEEKIGMLCVKCSGG